MFGTPFEILCRVKSPGSVLCLVQFYSLPPLTHTYISGKQQGQAKPASREFKKRLRLRQRQRQKAVILLVKRGKHDSTARATRTFCIALPYSLKEQRKMTNCQVLSPTWTNISESSLLSLCFKSICTNRVITY